MLLSLFHARLYAPRMRVESFGTPTSAVSQMLRVSLSFWLLLLLHSQDKHAR